ncbi:MAG: hypothetical protein ACRYHA_11450 [Janthinobacterium lividum]
MPYALAIDFQEDLYGTTRENRATRSDFERVVRFHAPVRCACLILAMDSALDLEMDSARRAAARRLLLCYHSACGSIGKTTANGDA